MSAERIKYPNPRGDKYERQQAMAKFFGGYTEERAAALEAILKKEEVRRKRELVAKLFQLWQRYIQELAASGMTEKDAMFALSTEIDWFLNVELGKVRSKLKKEFRKVRKAQV